MAEPPYGEIVDLLRAGQVVPFLGAGVNFGMRQPGAKWDDKTPGFLPSGAELSRGNTFKGDNAYRWVKNIPEIRDRCGNLFDEPQPTPPDITLPAE